MKKPFYMMRHGETVANKKDIAAGSSDSPLTEKGKEQAAEAESTIYATRSCIDYIVHSDLSRAEDTAKIVNRRMCLPMYKSAYLDGYAGRLLRSLKSVLGSSLVNERTQVGYDSYSFVEIIDLFIAHIKQTAEQQLQENLSSVVMGRPVFFVDNDPVADQRAENELKSILEKRGFKEISFEYEPIAAAKNYEATLTKEELVLVFDIGGGTSDFTLIRLSPDRHGTPDRAQDILANTGIHLGGTDFDKNFSLQTVMPEMGHGGTQVNGLPMPSHHYHSLATWHLINTLYTKKNLVSLRDLHAQSANKQLTSRLLKTVETQRGHEVADSVEKSKIALTEQKFVSVNLDFIESGWRIPVTPGQLEQSINRELDKIVEVALGTVVTLGGVIPEQVNTIFMTGGSTALPGFEERIKRSFPKAAIAHGNRFSSVVTGLGLTAIERYQKKISPLRINHPQPSF